MYKIIVIELNPMCPSCIYVPLLSNKFQLVMRMLTSTLQIQYSNVLFTGHKKIKYMFSTSPFNYTFYVSRTLYFISTILNLGLM